MQSLFLKGTDSSPEFKFEIESLNISISGNSSLEKSNPFYSSITEFLTSIESIKPIKLNVDVDLKSVCYNSKRGLVFFFLRLKELQVRCNTEIKINWIFTNSSNTIKRIGEDLEHMVMLPINLKISVKEEEELDLAPAF